MDEYNLVSIVMPTYNRETIIPGSIQSIQNQTYGNWELIIVDDGSTDQTEQLIQQYIETDNRIKYIKNERSKGPAGTRNTGITSAKGSYIAFLDSDDKWLEYHLKDSLNVMISHNMDICISLWVERTTDGKTHHLFNSDEMQKSINNKMQIFESKDNAILFDERMFEHYLDDESWFYSINSMVINKKILDSFGLFREDYKIAEDSEFLFRFMGSTRIALINNVHFIYHQSPNSIYFFCHRSELDNKSVLNNEELMGKITIAGYYSNKFRIMLRERLLSSSNIKNKKKYLKNLNFAISRKYFTLSIINRKRSIKAIHYCLLAIRYEVKLYKVLFLASLFVPFLRLNVDKVYLDIY
ncbi:glycosyltransferase family 2 protein [Paenibacillus glacialis]|uniref:glycosyltransferase family 2 protein n=1 Tax=Paenibacillus glacialis TaxID=494026 RepID=UPI000837ADFE|nr:glycosyltransferase family 2 protein [Paenibacillus glacialis]